MAQQGARANDHGCHDPCSEQHGSRQPRSWLIFDVSQMQNPRCAVHWRVRSVRVLREWFDLWVVRVSTGFGNEGSRCRVYRCRVRDRKPRMKAALVVSAKRLDESRSGFVVTKGQAANKAPEPTPGLVTSRAEMVSQMISSGKARLAPSPVVAHL